MPTAIEFCETRLAEKLQRYLDFAAGNRPAVADAVETVYAVAKRRPFHQHSLTTKRNVYIIIPSPCALPGDEEGPFAPYPVPKQS